MYNHVLKFRKGSIIGAGKMPTPPENRLVEML
jgi:hypothetical protein